MDHRTKVLLEAIETLRPELPTLVGAVWPQFEAQLAELEEVLRGQPADAVVTRAQILALFDRYPQARTRLVQLIAPTGATPKDPGVGRGGGAPDRPRTVTVRCIGPWCKRTVSPGFTSREGLASS